jgi:hypothetical protein
MIGMEYANAKWKRYERFKTQHGPGPVRLLALPALQVLPHRQLPTAHLLPAPRVPTQNSVATRPPQRHVRAPARASDMDDFSRCVPCPAGRFCSNGTITGLCTAAPLVSNIAVSYIQIS